MILLPAWKETLESLGMSICLIPYDATTCWNSLSDMVDFGLDHCKPIKVVTQKRSLGLREFELSDEEWAILKELCKVLKVRTH